MKNNSKKQTENYLKIPNHILNIPSLGRNEKLLLAHIYSFGKKGCWQSNSTLAEIFFCSSRTISLWISRLKKGKYLIYHHPKGYFRTFWARSHPEVQAAVKLKYNGREISKSDVNSGHGSSSPLRNNLRSDCAKSCELNAQKHVFPVRNNLPPTNNITNKEIKTEISATPSPLPAGGQSPALLNERKQENIDKIEVFKKKFCSCRSRDRPRPSPEEMQRRAQVQIKALMAAERKKAAPP